mgnify:CR=1 FL=1
MHNLKHNRVLHERNIILTIKTEDTPRVQRHERIEIDRVADTFIRVIAHYGFMETPSVPKILEHCRRKDLNIDIAATSFFLSRRSLKTTSSRRCRAGRSGCSSGWRGGRRMRPSISASPATAWSRSGRR